MKWASIRPNSVSSELARWIRLMKLSRLVKLLVVVPIIQTVAAGCLFFIQSGLGAGHGPLDFWIGVLGLPTMADYGRA
jgi:hypothetical protein